NIVDAYRNWTLAEKVEKIMADSLNNLGSTLRTNAETRKQAIDYFIEALNICKRIDDKYGQAIAFGGLGFIYYYIDADTALSYYNQALDLRQKIDDKSLTGSTLSSIALVYLNVIKDYEKAIEYYENAVAVRTEIEEWGTLGPTLTNQAKVYALMGQYEMAVKIYRQSYNISLNAGNHPGMALAMLKSGTILSNIGKYDQALTDLEISLQVYQAINDTLGIGDALTQMGFAYTNIGDYTSAIELFTEALRMYEGKDSWGIAGVYNNMGITYQAAKRLDKAEEYYKNALEYYEALEDILSTIVTLNNLGTVYYDLGDFEKAEENHAKGLGLSHDAGAKIEELSCLVNLANDQNRLQKLDLAYSNYQSGLQLAESLNNPEAIWKSLVGMAENYKLRGDFEKAIEYNERGLAIIEEMRNSMKSDEFKSTYLARERYAYEDVINMLGELHLENPDKSYDVKAFQLAEQSKSRALLDLLAESVVGAQNDACEFQVEQPLSLEEVQARCLGINTLLLEYYLGDINSWLWVINNSYHYLYKLPGREALQEQVELFRFALQNPDDDNIDFFLESGKRLYEILLQPLEQFSGSSNLVIVPDGILNYLPFEALVTGDYNSSTYSTYRDLPYLVLKYPVSYAQSSSVLNNLLLTNINENQDFGYDLVAFGDPVYSNNDSPADMEGNDLSRLLFSSQEVESIAKFFPGERSKVFLREQATEVNLKSGTLLSDCRYLHFATHGIIDEKNPDLSSVVLSQGIDLTEDGYFRADEIFKLETSASLVVLSACQTGLGKMIRGEGIVGLTRAFMYAGAPS
ncbi:MAG: tetratricopeptide repeat protein, partial [Bacteroidia bacterium]